MKSAQQIITLLELETHIEGGYFKESYRAEQKVKIMRDGIESIEPAATAIHFLLDKDKGGFSAWHRIADDEVWYYQAGEPMLVHYIDQQGQLHSTLIGNPIHQNVKTNQAVIPKHCWFAAEVGANNGFSLVGCSVSPAFDYAKFELADQAKLITDYPAHSDIINRLSIAT